MAWFLNPALTRFRAAVDAAWPNRDRTSDGTVADALHPAGSDHQPDPDGSVDAWDMDVDGVPVEHLKHVFQAHESSLYWIHNDEIGRRANGWKPEPYANYAGPNRNRHDKHVHWNTRQSHETSTAPWRVDVNLTDRVPWNGPQRERMVAQGWPAEGLTVAQLLTYTFERSGKDLAVDLEAFRAIVDEELDEQARTGADVD